MVISGITIQCKTPHKLHAMGNSNRIIAADPSDMSTIAVGVMGRFMVHPKLPKFTKGALDAYAIELWDALIELGCEESDIIVAATDFMKQIYKIAGIAANVDPEDIEEAADLSKATEGSATDSSSHVDGPATP